MDLLKQPLSRPFGMEEQVITLVSANAHIFRDIPVEKIKEFRLALLDYFAVNHGDLMSQIRQGQDLPDDLRSAIEEVSGVFKQQFLQDDAVEE